jgi:hypothetical protein
MARATQPIHAQLTSLMAKTDALHNVCIVLLASIAVQSKSMNNSFQYMSTALNARIDILLQAAAGEPNDIIETFEKVRAVQDVILGQAHSLAIATMKGT